MIKKSFCAFTNKSSHPLFTTRVREHQSNVTCSELIRFHQTIILVGYMGKERPSTHDLALDGWTRKSYQLGRQIACGATAGSYNYIYKTNYNNQDKNDSLPFPVVWSVVGPESLLDVEPLCRVQLNLSLTDCVH